MEPAEGAPALLTHRSPERRARAQPGTPRHVTARAGASREAGPARGTGVGREVALAREGLSGTGHVTGVQAPPAAPPLAGASRLTGGGRPGPTLPRAPQPGLGHEARGLRPASARGGFPDRRWGKAPASCSLGAELLPSPTARRPKPASRAPRAGPPALCYGPGPYEWPRRGGGAEAGQSGAGSAPAALRLAAGTGAERGAGPRGHVGRCRGGSHWPARVADWAFGAR